VGSGHLDGIGVAALGEQSGTLRLPDAELLGKIPRGVVVVGLAGLGDICRAHDVPA
jgi:hypothetical protein